MEAIWNKRSQGGVTGLRRDRIFHFPAIYLSRIWIWILFYDPPDYSIRFALFCLSWFRTGVCAWQREFLWYLLSLVSLSLVLEVRTWNRTRLSITLVSYMDGTGLGTVMLGVWFLSDCSLLFLITRLQNIYRQDFYGWILSFPCFFN